MPRPRSSEVSTRRVAALLCALGVCATLATEARADGLADEAELHFQLAAEAYQKADYKGALEHFLLSNRLVPNRNVVFNIARTFEQTKQLADAHRYYVDALEGETDPQIAAEIRAAVARVAPGVAVLDVVTSPPGATIYIDRRDLGSRGRAPRPLGFAEGKYTVIAALDGYESATSAPIEAKLGTSTRVELVLRRIVGKVHVDIEGAKSAAVRIGDELAAPACVAPCDLEIPPGPHLFYFTLDGHAAPSRTVNVVAGQLVRTVASMSPLTGSLVVSADERDALVTIDGQPMGFTPAVIQAVAVGTRKVTVSLRGYTTVARDVTVKANEQAQLIGLELSPVREVTAVSRFAENIDDAPSSVTVLDRQELAAFGYPTVASALRGVRGIYLSNDGAYESAGIRGLGEPNDYGNRVLVLSDGQSLNDNLINSSYIGSDARVDLHDVDRVEIVRGPGSLLYGTGAFSGVINLVTRPRDEPDQVHAGGGVYDDDVAHARAGFHYNFTRDAGVWASASGARSEGRDVALTLKDPEGGPSTQTARGVDRFRSGETAGRVWWGPLTAQWYYHQRKQQVPVGAYATLFDDPRTTNTDARAMGELRFEPKLSDSVQIMTRAHANHYTYDGEFAYSDAPDPLNTETYEGTWFGGEMRVVLTPSTKVRLTAGGEVQVHTQASIEGCCQEDVADAPYIAEDEPFNLGAGYGLVEASPTSWFRVSAGARVDVYSTFGPIFVPRVGLIFKPHERGVLKVMGGRAFRAPSVYEQIYNDGGLTQAAAVDEARDLELDPESVYQGEIEYSLRFKEDWVALVAAHASRITDIINTIEDTPGSEAVRYANSDEPVLAVGADLEVRREWRQGWMLSAMIGYQRAQYTGDGLTNKRVINSPERLASFRGVAPIVTDLVSAALRVSLESPRRIALDGDALTGTAAVADVVISGHVRRFGLRYAVGLYNLAAFDYDVPVADNYLGRTMPQQGRTLLFDLLATYP